MSRKPIWKMKEFWLPIIVGVSGAINVAIEAFLGIDLPIDYIVAAALSIIGVILGVDWARDQRAHG